LNPAWPFYTHGSVLVHCLRHTHSTYYFCYLLPAGRYFVVVYCSGRVALNSFSFPILFLFVEFAEERNRTRLFPLFFILITNWSLSASLCW
jgi:hypothetical protein